MHQAKDNGVKLAQVEADRLTRLVGKNANHQGVVARVKPVALTHSLDEVLEDIQGPPLLVILDGVTDPHNLGAIMRSADAFGVHAVEHRHYVTDLHATVLYLLGFDHEKLTYRYNGRDFRLTDVYGNVVKQVVA